jgi:purine-binding chemotaxis protein CheW
MTEEQMEFAEEDTMRGLFITFAVDGETYGIDIRYVTEIVGLQPISPLPEAPGHIKGIINLRGSIIPVVDLRLKFKKEPAEYTDRTCILVIETKDILAGLIVDEVSEVAALNDNDISPPPSFGAGTECRYLSGIGKAGREVNLLLDCEALFSGEGEALARAKEQRA